MASLAEKRVADIEDNSEHSEDRNSEHSEVIRPEELPKHWGLLELHGREVRMAVKMGRADLRTEVGLMKEMNLLLASLRRVEVRIEPQTITDFLKWKNRLAEYNGGQLPEGITAANQEANPHLMV